MAVQFIRSSAFHERHACMSANVLPVEGFCALVVLGTSSSCVEKAMVMTAEQM